MSRPKIDITKTYTSDGSPVRILCVDGPDTEHPVLGIVDGISGVQAWSPTGLTPNFFSVHTNSIHDLVEVKEKQVRYVNIYINKGATDKYRTPGENAYFYNNRHEADINANHNRVACIRIEFEEGEGLE